MSELEKIIKALNCSFMYQINCELTCDQSKVLLERITDLESEVAKQKSYIAGLLSDDSRVWKCLKCGTEWDTVSNLSNKVLCDCGAECEPMSMVRDRRIAELEAQLKLATDRTPKYDIDTDVVDDGGTNSYASNTRFNYPEPPAPESEGKE